MARKGKRGMKRRGGARKMKRHPISKGLAGVPDQASLTEVVNNRRESGAFYTTNIGYRFYNCSLNLFPRAQTVGSCYQEFRIRRITLAFKSTADTFLSSVGNAAIPQLYYMVDKKGTVPSTFTVDTLTSMGALPRRFDDKLKKIMWAPAVLQSSLTDPLALSTSAAAANISPWLPTNNQPGAAGAFVPSDVDHLGVSWFVYVPNGSTPIGYDIDIFVDFEFRKPLWKAPATGPKALEWNQAYDAVTVDPVPASSG